MAPAEYDLVVIGAGAGGLTAARFVIQLGARVLLAERDLIGGDCTWTGCVPSKALLRAAKAAHDIRTRATLRIGDRVVAARHYLVCTGATPVTPDLPGLAETPHFTYHNVFDLSDLPPSLLVVGGGPLGMELGRHSSGSAARSPSSRRACCRTTIPTPQPCLHPCSNASRAGEMSGELSLAIAQGLTVGDVANAVHAYPTARRRSRAPGAGGSSMFQARRRGAVDLGGIDLAAAKRLTKEADAAVSARRLGYAIVCAAKGSGDRDGTLR